MQRPWEDARSTGLILASASWFWSPDSSSFHRTNLELSVAPRDLLVGVYLPRSHMVWYRSGVKGRHITYNSLALRCVYITLVLPESKQKYMLGPEG